MRGIRILGETNMKGGLLMIISIKFSFSLFIFTALLLIYEYFFILHELILFYTFLGGHIYFIISD